jgi:outer membrane protein OmpA-like peptidoglycan-associated protein
MMRSTPLILLSLLAATAGPAFAQDETTDADAMTEEVMDEMADEVMEEEMTDEVMADEVVEEDMADEAMTDEVMDEDMVDEPAETPSLEEIAASDPALEVRTNEDGEVDAMVMLSDVLFSFGDASLEPAALDVLRDVAEKLDGVPSIEITGHTDAIGDEEFNLTLGQRRADAVRDWLVANTALTADVVSARGVGEADPIAENLTDDGADNPDGRALNRRVEFTLPEEG